MKMLIFVTQAFPDYIHVCTLDDVIGYATVKGQANRQT